MRDMLITTAIAIKPDIPAVFIHVAITVLTHLPAPLLSQLPRYPRDRLRQLPLQRAAAIVMKCPGYCGKSPAAQVPSDDSGLDKQLRHLLR